MKDVWSVFLATLFGVLVFIVHKLGPTVIIFAYLYSLEHIHAHSVNIFGADIPMSHLLVLLITLLSVLMVSFKSIMVSTSRRLDESCIHIFDALVLRHIHQWDLSLGMIRAKALGIHAALKAFMLFTLLAALAAVNSLIFPVIIGLVLIVTMILAYRYPTPTLFQSMPHIQPILLPENYSELILIFGLLIGFLIAVPDRTSLIGSVVVLLLVARFSGQLKVFARTIAKIAIWRNEARARQGQPPATA